MVRGPHGGELVKSRAVKTVVPAGRRGGMSLQFSHRARLRIKHALARRPVYVVVYAGSTGRPIATRKIVADG
jgi:hypothetical protein